jgi:hypothetical protein
MIGLVWVSWVSGREPGCTAAFRRAYWGYGCGMHKFKIGQHLFPARSVGLNVSEGVYVIIKRLPERDGEFE